MNHQKSENFWPPQPVLWPDILTDIELAQYLRLDQAGHSPESAKRTLRYLRRERGLPCLGRLANRVLFRKESVDAWLSHKEQHDQEHGVSEADERQKLRVEMSPHQSGEGVAA